MEITEVRVKLVKDTSDQLKAFCSITLDGSFVIRDLKVIERRTGFFVAMPSRKVSDRCPKCRYKNHIRARFCNECGEELHSARGGRVKLYVDVAHPINSECRQLVQQRVIDAFEEEFERAKEPGYVGSDYDETDGDGFHDAADATVAANDDSRDDREDTSLTAGVDSADDERDDSTDDDGDGKRDAGRDAEPRASEYDELIRSLKSEAQARRSRHDGTARPVHTSPPRVESTLDEPESTDEPAAEEPADEEPVVEESSASEPEPTPAPKPRVEPARVTAAPIAPRPEPEPAPREPDRPEPPARPSAPARASSFGEGLDVDEPADPPSVKAPSQDRPVADSPSEAVPSHAESTEDDGAFGAGIL